MKKSLCILILSIPFLVSAQTGPKNFIDQNYIEVTGKAEIEVAPNLIYLRIILDEKENKGKISLGDMEKRMIDKLTEIGVDIEKDLAIKDLTSNFKFYLLLKTDIILSKEYILTVYDAKSAARVFVEFQKIDISNISVAKLDHTDIEKFRKEVKILAIKAAKDKAEYLALAIDQSIGRAIFIQELQANSFSNQNTNILIRGTPGASSIYGSRAPSLPNIEFEKLRFEYSIQVRFELK